ncbi:hypothetical protein B0H16DRAFT_1737348 [Mycena metata]|uniref:Uncharacterized protein n=1 Tax=Mycena metata TaxID=1033252 RepID=A0AAD7MLJ5_9AGAR|nr:hypothetical protein B0H16DRAFT_1737348 [Mycena metata]
MSPPLHNAHPVSNLPPVPPGYVACAGRPFYDASFQSEQAHSARKNRYFWLLAMGPHQGFYSTQATATHKIPHGCSRDDALEYFDHHLDMHAAWRQHCYHRHGRCAIHFACHLLPCNQHPDAPTNAEIEAQNAANIADNISKALNDAGTLVLEISRAANRTLRAVQASASRGGSSAVSPAPSTASFGPVPPVSESQTPAPSRGMSSVRSTGGHGALPPGQVWARCGRGHGRGRAVTPPSSRPSLPPPPYSSPPRLNNARMPSPSPSPPLSGALQEKPMRMRTGFQESRRRWNEQRRVEAEQGARGHTAQGPSPPRRIASVELTRAPSTGVTVGLVPKPELESDPELERVPLFDPNSSDEEKRRPRMRNLSPHPPLFDSDSGEEAADVEMLCISSSRSPSPPPSSLAPSITSSAHTPPSVISIPSTAPSVISISSTSSLSASISSTAGAQEATRYTGPFRLTMLRRAQAEAFRIARLQNNPGASPAAPPAPRGTQPSSLLPRSTQLSAPLGTTTQPSAPASTPPAPCSAQPSSAASRGGQPSPAASRGAHPSPAPSRGAHPSLVSPPRPAQLSSHSISVATSVATSTSSALPRLDFTRPPPYRSPPPPAVPQPHRNPTSFVPNRDTSIFWVSESYGVVFLNSDHAYEDAGAHGVQMFNALEPAMQHSERHSLPGGLPHEFPQSGRERRYISMWSGAVYRNPWGAFQDGGAYGMVSYYGTEQELLDRVASLRAAGQFRDLAIYWV